MSSVPSVTNLDEHLFSSPIEEHDFVSTILDETGAGSSATLAALGATPQANGQCSSILHLHLHENKTSILIFAEKVPFPEHIGWFGTDLMLRKVRGWKTSRNKKTLSITTRTTMLMVADQSPAQTICNKEKRRENE